VALGLLTGSWSSLSASPNEGVQATAYSLRFAVLRCGFQPRLTPGVRRLNLLSVRYGQEWNRPANKSTPLARAHLRSVVRRGG
jgi:hypothetical protein